MTREWPADWPPARRDHQPPAWLYLVIVAMVAIIAGMPELGPLFHEPMAYLGLFGLFLVLAGLFPRWSFRLPRLPHKSRPIDRRERDRRLAEVARARIPLIARHTALQLDDELHRAITALADGDRPDRVAGRLDRLTGGGRDLSRRARMFCAMAIGMLGDLPEDELERALREAESCLWAEHLSTLPHHQRQYQDHHRRDEDPPWPQRGLVHSVFSAPITGGVRDGEPHRAHRVVTVPVPGPLIAVPCPRQANNLEPQGAISRPSRLGLDGGLPQV